MLADGRAALRTTCIPQDTLAGILQQCRRAKGEVRKLGAVQCLPGTHEAGPQHPKSYQRRKRDGVKKGGRGNGRVYKREGKMGEIREGKARRRGREERKEMERGGKERRCKENLIVYQQ